ncbi:hypothetical protein BDF22DRAFT_736053 [Syncephalis plumigaleata]|nr:hypothetical protein BDF22DRAFT_736053 [Syncephalis plumigaleata]
MTSPPMEVEIKIRLPGREDYDKLVSILEKTLVSTEYQENHFFDGPNSELREKRNVLRTRLIQEMKKDEIVDKYAVVTLKGNAQLVDGISRVEEYEDRIGWNDAKAVCVEPARLLQLEQHYRYLHYCLHNDKLTNCHGPIW